MYQLEQSLLKLLQEEQRAVDTLNPIRETLNKKGETETRLKNEKQYTKKLSGIRHEIKKQLSNY